MRIHSNSFRDQGRIPGRCAFATRSVRGHVQLAANRNPHLAWRGTPAGTRSLVLTCIDGDAPTRADDVNREGRAVARDLRRAEFVHWLLIDLPPDLAHIDEGSCSLGVIPGGKAHPQGPAGSRQGRNDYTGWFAGDAAMAGTWRGYDGPCPPWNDARVHRYRFEILATDLPRCPVPDDFALPELRAALAGHVLGRAAITGLYSLNPQIALRP